MDEPKQPRDPKTGKLITQYRADGPLPMPPPEAAMPPAPTQERKRGGPAARTMLEKPFGVDLERLEEVAGAEPAIPEPPVRLRAAVFVAHGAADPVPDARRCRLRAAPAGPGDAAPPRAAR